MKKKKHNTFQNMLYCAHCTALYSPSLFVWSFLLLLCQVAVPVLEMYLPQRVIQELVSQSPLSLLLLTVILFTASLAFFSGLKRFIEQYLMLYKNQMGLFYLHKIAKKSLSTDYTNQESAKYRTLQEQSFQTCRSSESPLRNVYMQWAGFFAGLIGFTIYSSILIGMNPLIVVLLMITTLVSYFIHQRVNHWVEHNSNERSDYHHRLSYIDYAADDIRSAKDIRLYNMTGWLDHIYQTNMDRIRHWYRKYSKVLLFSSIMDAVLLLLREGFAYAYLLYLAFHGKISPSDFVLYFAAITGFSNWLFLVMEQFVGMNSTSIAVNQLRDFLDYPESFRHSDGIPLPDLKKHPGKIVLNHVAFRYPESENAIYHDLNLTIEPGEHIGIVGLNGAGKTTLMKLICGLTDPDSGSVLYEGQDIRLFNRSDYYSLFSAVFQQFSILPLSIREIVSEETTEDEIQSVHAHYDNAQNTERILQCLKLAGLSDKIEQLPDGLDTWYDPSIHDNGVVLSGGETQKLLLARAIYKDCPVLLLDEPTAALDPLSENHLYEIYHKITEGKTSLFISHRLASTRFCDRIILIDHGQIAEEGTHDSLIARKGLYYQLFETQANYYREHPEGGSANE